MSFLFFLRFSSQQGRKNANFVLSRLLCKHTIEQIYRKKAAQTQGNSKAKRYYLLGPIINLLYGNHIFIESAITLHANSVCVCGLSGFHLEATIEEKEEKKVPEMIYTQLWEQKRMGAQLIVIASSNGAPSLSLNFTF
jgi:hypothetical protein